MLLSSLALIHAANPLSIKPTFIPDMLQIKSSVEENNNFHHSVTIYIHDDTVSLYHTITDSKFRTLYKNCLTQVTPDPKQWITNLIAKIENEPLPAITIEHEGHLLYPRIALNA